MGRFARETQNERKSRLGRLARVTQCKRESRLGSIYWGTQNERESRLRRLARELSVRKSTLGHLARRMQ